ncbi:hypothetical protein NHX12_025854, partial [Muraenolepis orangiensis]
DEEKRRMMGRDGRPPAAASSTPTLRRKNRSGRQRERRVTFLMEENEDAPEGDCHMRGSEDVLMELEVVMGRVIFSSTDWMSEEHRGGSRRVPLYLTLDESTSRLGDQRPGPQTIQEHAMDTSRSRVMAPHCSPTTSSRGGPEVTLPILSHRSPSPSGHRGEDDSEVQQEGTRSATDSAHPLMNEGSESDSAVTNRHKGPVQAHTHKNQTAVAHLGEDGANMAFVLSSDEALQRQDESWQREVGESLLLSSRPQQRHSTQDSSAHRGDDAIQANIPNPAGSQTLPLVSSVCGVSA